MSDNVANDKMAGHEPFIKLLHDSACPIYAIDPAGRIVFCNAALSDWLGTSAEDVVGRQVEYHSEVIANTSDPSRSSAKPAPLTGLCPPPRVGSGRQVTSTVSCVDRKGRLVHRRGCFLPLNVGVARDENGQGAAAGIPTAGVLAILEARDLTPTEVSQSLTDEPTPDDLHRTIRLFRRNQAGNYAVESLLGDSSAMRKVRSQVIAAAQGGCNVLVAGPPGTGRTHVAKAIHYLRGGDGRATLISLDAVVLNEDHLRRALNSIEAALATKSHTTLLIRHVDQLSMPLQSTLVDFFCHARRYVQMIGTARVDLLRPLEAVPPEFSDEDSDDSVEAGAVGVTETGFDPLLFDMLSTMTVELPALRDRLEDVPVLAQYFLEAANCGNPKQIGSVSRDALERLVLYSWPGDLDELRQVIRQAHRACQTHEIQPADLPAVIHHAVHAASLPSQTRERIVLDQFLARIERELIERAIVQSGGNKAEAARMLGMTRPRLYRRLVQLGLEQRHGEEQVS